MWWRKKIIEKIKDGENVSSLEEVEVVLVQYNLVGNQYQQESKMLYTFTPNKSYTYLLNVKPSNLVFLKTCNLESGDIIITYADQNSKLLKIEDKVNLILFIGN